MKSKKIILVVILVILIIALAVCGDVARKMRIFGKIEEEVSKYNNYENYYIKLENSSGYTQEYFKMGNKEKLVTVNTVGMAQIKVTEYYDGTKKVIYTETPENRIAKTVEGASVNQPVLWSLGFENSGYWIKIAMTTSVKESDYNDKKCYYIDGSYLQDTYIEEDTGLTLANKNGESKIKYEYKFDTVKESDFEIPDAEKYEEQ